MGPWALQAGMAPPGQLLQLRPAQGCDSAIHTQLCLHKCISHSDCWLVFFPLLPGYSPILGKGKRNLQPSLVLLLPLHPHTCGVLTSPSGCYMR